MKNLSAETCRKLKEARRAAGLSQSVLAAEIGCKQSALSMFEQGDGTKLNDEVIQKLAQKFGVELKEAEETASPAAVEFCGVSLEVHEHTGFCPNPHCPSHHAYRVEGRLLLKPDRVAQDPVGGKYCAICGEILERKCPNCGAPVHEGAICSRCGEPYVTVP